MPPSEITARAHCGAISTPQPNPIHVVIAGGGVAALEAALALRALAGDELSLTLVAPNERFVYRPMRVREPFAFAAADQYELARFADDVRAELIPDRVERVECEHRMVRTESGIEVRYDALLLAVGAEARPRHEHAITIDDAVLDALLHGVIQDVELGYIHSLAFVIPDGRTWPLPVYELALMTAARAYDMDVDVAITIVTPEMRPLAIFGDAVSDGVEALLEERGIATVCAATSLVPRPGTVTISPGSRELTVDRVIALPELVGIPVTGVPAEPESGFTPIEASGKVRGLERVYAAGDGTDFPIKFGGIAAQQADAAAQAIIALAGLESGPPSIQGSLMNAMLLTGSEPLFLSARISEGRILDSQLGVEAAWSPSSKISAKYLSPYLESRR